MPNQISLADYDYDDAELGALAREWRLRAGRGDREAFGIAHALERELRDRTRASQYQPIEVAPSAGGSRPWWSFWRTNRRGDSGTGAT